MGQGGCERRIEVFRKIKKKKIRGASGWWGVRVDKNEELKFLGKFKKILFFWGGGRVVGGSGWI